MGALLSFVLENQGAQPAASQNFRFSHCANRASLRVKSETAPGRKTIRAHDREKITRSNFDGQGRLAFSAL
jgi:hypothetical protein